MVQHFSISTAAAVGGLALASLLGAGAASAAPDLGPAVNTTCSYQQVMAALEAADPAAAAQFNASGSGAYLQQFLASPPPQRQFMAQMIASSPGNQPYIGLMSTVFSTCNNF
jgi:hemophore-related protein